MEENLFIDESPIVIENKTAVAITPQFDELSIFFAPGDVAETIKNNLLESYSSLQAFVIAKKWSEVFAEAEKSMKEKAINQTNSKKEEIEFKGRVVATVSERALGAKFNYADPTLLKMMQDAENLDTAIKERKKLLETIKTPVANVSTGEMMVPAEKIEVGKTIVVKFTKEGK